MPLKISKRLIIRSILIALAIGVSVVFLPTTMVWLNARGKSFSDVADCPTSSVGVVLGTSAKVGGKENHYFTYRMDAAEALYKSGKVKCLIVSGDNRSKYYNEPLQMFTALTERGVPKDKIVLDFAGLRTLDSVVRAQKVFEAKDVVFVSQRFHNNRALYIADHINLKAVGLNAQDVSANYGLKTNTREIFARVKMWLDLNILNTQPRFLGEKEHLPL